VKAQAKNQECGILAQKKILRKKLKLD